MADASKQGDALQVKAIDQSDMHPVVIELFGDAERYISPRGARVIRASPLGIPVFFVIYNRKDRIHKLQLKGLFYEQEILKILSDHMPDGGVFVDVGANIGNHTLFMLRHGGASRAVPIEPNPEAIRLFAAMVRLNGLDAKVERATLGYGIGSENVEGYAIHNPKGNLGWARLTKGEGDIELRTGDSLLAREDRIDLIKIDVEGMEISALAGLSATIKRFRPKIFVEVDILNRDEFFTVLKTLNYTTIKEFPQMRQNQNFLLGPA